jgi:hypothetical protein
MRTRSKLRLLRGPRAGSRAVAFFLVTVAACAAPALILPAQEPSPTATQVKAAFLYNFAKFIEWPAASYAGAEAPFVIGVLGEDPIRPELEQMVAGKSVNGRAFQVRKLAYGQDLRRCQILFINASEGKHLPAVLHHLQASSVLVVGDTENFVELGGAVRFFVEADRMRFEINVDAVNRARLNVSSKLLSLAWLTTDPQHGGGK